MKDRYAIQVTGRVQGVGFRFFLQCLAAQYCLSGWVRNDSDGSVSAELEGETDNLDACIQKIRQGPSFGFVEEVSLQQITCKGDKRFRILSDR